MTTLAPSQQQAPSGEGAPSTPPGHSRRSGPKVPRDAQVPKLHTIRGRIMYAICWSAAWLFGRIFCQLEVRGSENLPRQGPCIVAANHASHVDPPLLALIGFRLMRFWAKSELFEVPVLGTILDYVGCIPLRRGAADRASLKMVMDALERGDVVTMFPEGTRSRDGKLQEPQRGAGLIWKKAGVPVIPVFIEGSHAVFPPGAKFPRRGKVVIHVGAALELPPDFALACNGTDPYHHLAKLIMRRIRARQIAA